MRKLSFLVLLVIGISFGWYLRQNQPENSLAPPPSPIAANPTAASPTAEIQGTPAEAPAQASTATTTATVEREAKQFITTLAATEDEPVAVDRADHFVTKEQVISLLPDSAVELVTPIEISQDPSLAPDTPITVIRELEQEEVTTPEKIIAAAGGDLRRSVRVVQDDDSVTETTVAEVLERYRQNPQEPITILRTVKYFEISSPREISAATAPAERAMPLKIIRKPYRLESATIAELLRQTGEYFADHVYYVRTVRGSDAQGIWGIIHHGLTENFAQGMAVRRGREIDTYRVEIPPDADERLGDNSSSFLGKLLDGKVRESYVYNIQNNRMGRNPDEILPGQQIIIVDFSPEEIISIYRHFVERRG